jgi:hypothetical protein
MNEVDLTARMACLHLPGVVRSSTVRGPRRFRQSIFRLHGRDR